MDKAWELDVIAEEPENQYPESSGNGSDSVWEDAKAFQFEDEDLPEPFHNQASLSYVFCFFFALL